MWRRRIRPGRAGGLEVRLWSLHPSLLDRQGLTACWREALLAQAVLAGRTRGYTAHPQLQRFRTCRDPGLAIGVYLGALCTDAVRRGYRFDSSRIERLPSESERLRMTVSEGQLAWEWGHLLRKLEVRSRPAYADAIARGAPIPHPLFTVVPGPIATWERGV